jgi:hypothetical protein
MIDYEKLKEAHELAKHAKIDLVTTVRTFAGSFIDDNTIRCVPC